MKAIIIFSSIIISSCFFAQKTSTQVGTQHFTTKTTSVVSNTTTTNPIVAKLIPYKSKTNGKYGYITQNKTIHIPAEYDNVGFFAEDCNLLNSPNLEARKFGTKEYASVRKAGVDYRIDTKGKRVYQYSTADLAPCTLQYKKQKYNAYRQNGFYGIVEAAAFNPNVQNFVIYPQYEYLHILEGDDIENPMIIACKQNLFGVIDVNGRVIIPFQYSDIKRNYSWKLGKLFEVTKNGTDYYYIDINNKAY